MKPALLIPLRTFLVALLLVFSLVLPPEGMFRDGSYQLVVLGWIFAALLTLGINVTQPRRSGPRRMARVMDSLVACFFLWIGLSFLYLCYTKSGNIRYATNAFWLWESFGLVYMVFRTGYGSRNQNVVRFLLLMLVGVSLAQAGYAVYAYTIRDPQMRRDYLADPETMLAESGLHYEPGSPERILLENRILGSTEPLGTYALTNTLAGVLLPALILLFVCLCRYTGKLFSHTTYPAIASRAGPVVLAALMFTLLFVCLLLTKSRTGILSLAIGLALIPATFLLLRVSHALDAHKAVSGGKRGRRLLLITFAVAFLLACSVSLAFWTGALDREVLTETSKSLGYRIQYWIASSHMIGDYPWLGVGPGNFQNRYPQYMLPQASEVIADPHNFFFEIAVGFGLPAIVFFLTIVGLFAAMVCHALTNRETADSVTEQRNASDTSTGGRMPVILGGMTGMLSLFFLSKAMDSTIDAVFVGIAIICIALVFIVDRIFAGVWQSRNRGRDFVVFLPALAGAILLNLCAAGGTGYPAIAVLLWMGIGLFVSWYETSGRGGELENTKPNAAALAQRSGRWASIVIPAGSFLLLLAAFLFAERLFITNNLAQAILNNVAAAESRLYYDVTQTLGELDTACRETDPYSIPLAKKYYELASARYIATANQAHEQSWRTARAHLLAVAPHSASIAFLVGEREWNAVEKDSVFVNSAKEALALAVARAPGDAKYHALFALALLRAGESDAAQEEAKIALRLSEQTPHNDRKLPENLIVQLEKIIS
ncbi:MAG: O-antigen ligase family protein [Planctomycetia bacterium]|nr:O-antigen ligase family protein [Planctomycetia bacterium]